MNDRALELMRQALETISAIHKPTSAAADTYDLEEVVEKLDFAVITARKTLDRISIPPECNN